MAAGLRGPDGSWELADWFVRRAGLARFCTVLCASGLAFTAFTGPMTAVACSWLGIALIVLLIAAKRRQAAAGRALVVLSVLSIGLCSGLLLGAVRVADLNASHLQSHTGETAEFELVVTGAVRVSGVGQSAAALARQSGAEDGVRGESVWLEVPAGFELRQGMILRARANIEAPQGKSASGYDQRRQLLQQGIHVVLAVRRGTELAVVGKRGGVAGAFDALREAARRNLSLGPDARVNEVLQGVVMGDTAGIDQGWLEAFRRSGTAHMLSVSGLHVGCLAVIIIGLARLLRAPRWAGFFAAAAAAVLMVPFVGPSPPIIRSAVMIVVVLAGRWVGRGRDQWQILALAAVVILALNPYAVFDVGFQLSFSAFVGMMAVAPRLQRLLTRLPASVASNVAVSLAAGLGTAPVALAQFGRTSLISPLANLLVVPALPAITGLGMASVFGGLIWHGLSVALDTLASLPMMWTVMVSSLMALAPVLDSRDLGRALAAMVGGLLLLPAALASTGRTVRAPLRLPLPFFKPALVWLKRHRPRRRGRARAVAVALVVAGMGSGFALQPAGAEGVRALQTLLGGRSWPDCVEVRVLDVGQGTAVLVRTPGRHSLLFDCGPAACGLAGQLRSLGVRKLDVVVISHPHADHFAGLIEALAQLEIETLVDSVRVDAAPTRAPPAGGAGATQASGGGRGTGGAEAREYLDLRAELARRGCRLVTAATGDSLVVDGVTVRFFAPSGLPILMDTADPWGGRGAPTGDELNAASLAALVSIGEVDTLLPGDAEADTLGTYTLPGAEIVVVPHHGSKGAVSDALLARLAARLAIVSVGEGNSFGHPDRGTIASLEQAKVAVVRTDTAGWVSCRVKQGLISMTTERTPTR